jgi:hypothetical protein
MIWDKTYIETITKKYGKEYKKEMVGNWKPFDALRLRLDNLVMPTNTETIDGDEHKVKAHTGDGLMIYSVIRDTQPEIVVETGVQNGFITEIILGAMEVNGKGKLISIDCGGLGDDPCRHKTWEANPGKYIRKEFKHRWDLRLGLSKVEMPILVKELKEKGIQIDIFHHDSDHSKENIDFEMNTIKDSLKPEGIMMMHDRGGRLFEVEASGEYKRMGRCCNSSTEVWHK